MDGSSVEPPVSPRSPVPPEAPPPLSSSIIVHSSRTPYRTRAGIRILHRIKCSKYVGYIVDGRYCVALVHPRPASLAPALVTLGHGLKYLHKGPKNQPSTGTLADLVVRDSTKVAPPDGTWAPPPEFVSKAVNQPVQLVHGKPPIAIHRPGQKQPRQSSPDRSTAQSTEVRIQHKHTITRHMPWYMTGNHTIVPGLHSH